MRVPSTSCDDAGEAVGWSGNGEVGLDEGLATGGHYGVVRCGQVDTSGEWRAPLGHDGIGGDLFDAEGHGCSTGLHVFIAWWFAPDFAGARAKLNEAAPFSF